MRNIQFAFLVLIFLFSACARNGKVVPESEPEAQPEAQTESQGVYQNKSVSATPVIKEGEVNVITEEQFVKWVTDVNNDKGFQYRWNVPAIVDCYADWCRPCHAINPIMVELAEKYKGKVIIYKLNVEKAANVSEAFGISSIPTLLFFKPNAQPVKLVGAQSIEAYEQAIRQLLLDE